LNAAQADVCNLNLHTSHPLQNPVVEAQLQTDVIGNMQIGLCIMKLMDKADARSLVLVSANPAASEFTGVPMDSCIGQRWLDIFPEVSDELLNAYVSVVKSQKKLDLGEVLYGDERVEKGYFSIKLFPLPEDCVGIAFENVTARKQEEALHIEQAAKLKVLFDYAAVGVASLSVTGEWTQVNQELCDLLGYTMPELLGKTFAEVTYSADAEVDNEVYQQLVSGQKDQVSFEKRYVTKQKQVIWAEVTVSNVYDGDGKLSCFIATIQDITAIKDANASLQRQKNDLVAVNMMLTNTMTALEHRNQELDQFAYVTSHDLKAPLRAIANLTTWIEEDLGSSLPEENAEQFELLKNRVHRMEGLINGLLEYSRIGRTHQSHERVDLTKLLAEIVDSLAPPAGFIIELPTDLPVIQAKKIPLIQIFSNLLSNALRHHHCPSEGRVKVSVQDLKDFYAFEIADNGPGIDTVYHEKIFTIFQTLQSRDDFESTGIGLSVVQKAVVAEGGTVSLASAAGEGATFRFTWPKAPHVGVTMP